MTDHTDRLRDFEKMLAAFPSSALTIIRDKRQSILADLSRALEEIEALRTALAWYGGIEGDAGPHQHDRGSCHMCGFDFGQRARARLQQKEQSHEG